MSGWLGEMSMLSGKAIIPFILILLCSALAQVQSYEGLVRQPSKLVVTFRAGVTSEQAWQMIKEARGCMVPDTEEQRRFTERLNHA